MKTLILRELRLAGTGGQLLLPLVFFLLVATLFPFAIEAPFVIGVLIFRWCAPEPMRRG